MSDCIFCKIINEEIPSATIYENEEFKVILDRFPANEGHVLLLPKAHSANIFEIVMQNNGTVAGQTVFHFHLHLIPRYENDGITIAYKPMDLTNEQIEHMRKKLELAL